MVESIKELRKICYKDSNAKRPLYMEWVTMKISIYITKLLLYTPIRADQVTIGMILLTIAGSAMMAFGTIPLLLIGMTIIHLTIILDNCNGEVARYRKEGNMTGTFLEQLYHDTSIPLLFFGLSFGIFLDTGWTSVLVFGFLCAFASKSIILPSIMKAVVKNAVRDRKNNRVEEKVARYSKEVKKVNVDSGSTKSGSSLHNLYAIFQELWSYPFNIVIMNIILLLELYNATGLPSYMLIYLYVAVYGIVSALIQVASFFVHYKGKTVVHYYLAIQKKK